MVRSKCYEKQEIHGLVQEYSNSIALVMELLQSCTKASKSSRLLMLGTKINSNFLYQKHTTMQITLCGFSHDTDTNKFFLKQVLLHTLRCTYSMLLM